MKARENSVWKGHGWSYWTAGGRDSFITSFSEVKMGCYIIFFFLQSVTKSYNPKQSENGHPTHPPS